MFRVAAPAAVHELGGPGIYSYREVVQMVRRRVGAKALLVPLPFPVWHALAGVAERLPSPPIPRDPVAPMRRGNAVSGAEAGFRTRGGRGGKEGGRTGEIGG